MSEPKPLASLSSSLLARKGQAKPAMRPQSYGSFGFGNQASHDDLGWNDMGHDATTPHPTLSLTPLASVPAGPAEIVPIVSEPLSPEIDETTFEPPVVVKQREELAREVAQFDQVEPEPVEPATVEIIPAVPTPVGVTEEIVRTISTRAAAGSKGKAAFTLRLDPDRHLRLRLSCAVLHKSAQAIVVAALDAFLDAQPAVADLARTANERKSK